MMPGPLQYSIGLLNLVTDFSTVPHPNEEGLRPRFGSRPGSESLEDKESGIVRSFADRSAVLILRSA